MSTIENLCGASADNFLTGFEGAVSGITGLLGIGGFWDVNSKAKEEQEEVEQRLQQTQSEWTKKMNEARANHEDDKAQLIENRISLYQDIQNYTFVTMKQKIEENHVLILGTIGVVSFVVIFLFSLPSNFFVRGRTK